MFVKSLKGADEDAAVLQDASHPEVNVLQHFAALSHRLKANHKQTLGFGVMTSQRKVY